MKTHSHDNDSGSAGSLTPMEKAISRPGFCCVCDAPIVESWRIRCAACHEIYRKTVEELHAGKPPYPFCSQPEKCIAAGRCTREICCNE